MFTIKVLLVIGLIVWCWLGYFLISRFQKLFGPHPDDPAESAGARSFGIAHIVAIWIGTFCIFIYFLQK